MSLYRSAIIFMDSINPKIERGFIFREKVNDEVVNSFNSKLLGNRNTDDLTAISGILKPK